MKKLTLFITLLFTTVFTFAQNKIISDFTENKIFDFLTQRPILRDLEHKDAVLEVQKIQENTFSELKENAIDYEQEYCILKSFYSMEIYEHSVTEKNRSVFRAMMKSQMEENIKCIENRSEKKLTKWIYMVTGDVMSIYMTRSITATFYYGFKVKDYYAKSVEKDKYMPEGNVSLGGWYFYAPGICGGSNRKAEELLKNAVKGAEISQVPGEMFLAYEYLSQFYYEIKKYDLCKKYLQKAKDLNIGLKEINLIENCNKNGYSLFQYNRNKTGIDQEMPESEKDEND